MKGEGSSPLTVEGLKTCDLHASLVRTRVPLRGQHYAYGSGIGGRSRQRRFQLTDFPVHDSFHYIDDIRLHQGQDYLGLRVAEAAVELHHLRSAGRHHQATIQDALKGAPETAHLRQHGSDDQVFGLGHQVRRHHRRRGVRAHAPRVGPHISLADGLVVLGGNECQKLLAICQGKQGGLLSRHELLHHHLCSGRAEDAAPHHLPDRCQGFLLSAGDHHPLARGQAGSLDHDWCTPVADVVHGGFAAGEGAVLGGGHADSSHELFGKDLVALQPRRLGGGSKDAQVRLPETIDKTGRQAVLRPDNSQVDALLQGEGTQSLDFGGESVQVGHRLVEPHVRQAVGEGGYPGAARGGVDLSNTRTAGDLPDEGVLSTPLSHDEYFHVKGPSFIF